MGQATAPGSEDAELANWTFDQDVAVTGEHPWDRPDLTLGMTRASSKIRVMVADDHPLYLASLARIVDSTADFELAGAAGDGYEALEMIEAERPDVAVIDMQMPGVDGAQVVARAKARGVETATILISGYADGQALYAAIASGADGILSKNTGVEAIAAAIATVAAGEAVLSRQAQTALVAGVRARDRETKVQLTTREREVLALAAKGLSNKQIAGSLSLGAETVKTHLRSVYEKLDASGRVAAVSTAISRGLLPLPTPAS